CVLKGGKEATYSNTCLVGLIHASLEAFSIPPAAVTLLPTDRKYVAELLTATRFVDIIIPRGSESLIQFVRKNSLVPTIETGAGVCHTYVEKTADLDKARAIVVNAKVSRPSVCNSLDTVVVDREVAEAFLPTLKEGLSAYDVEIFADQTAYPILKAAGYPLLKQAQPEDFGREFLDYKCSVRVVEGLPDALAHIREYSSRHSEAIVSQDMAAIETFLNEVDAAAVYANASTRFTDGGVFALGAEIGISTQKLHARGPFALEKLVTEKWIVRGNGQVRS
ncbi:MAG: glutamate-5-semialdehyde dehydrogenase, partial [Bacteroidetes bacterium]|nr:glutamate-5-semialdehyde dehydrogenase [Bacteroidota bacterium]